MRRQNAFWLIAGVTLMMGLPRWSEAESEAFKDLQELFPELQLSPAPSPPQKSEIPKTQHTFSEKPIANPSAPLQVSGSFRERSAFRINAPQRLTQLRSFAYFAGTGSWSDAAS